MGKRIYVEWTETYSCAHEFDLDEARDFLESQGMDVPEDAELADMLELFGELDLEDALGEIGIDGALSSDCDVTVEEEARLADSMDGEGLSE